MSPFVCLSVTPGLGERGAGAKERTELPQPGFKLVWERICYGGE